MLPWIEPYRYRINAALSEERFGHAPMIVGPPGLGKGQLAEWLLARLLCLSPAHGSACGECRSCELLAAGSHPDCFRVGIPEDKKEIPVDSVRQLSASLQLTPSIGSQRAGLIDPAEAMNRNAANALLKTLEEPHPGAWLILLSHRPASLPATIRSRCQSIVIRPPEPEQAIEWLSSACPEASEQTVHQALNFAGGAPLAARALLGDGGLEFGQKILAGLKALAAGEAVATVLDEEWTSNAGDTWRWLSQWTALCLSGSLSHEPEGRRVEMPPVDARSAARLWQSALDARGMADSAVRQELAMARWLIEWQSCCQKG